MSGQNSQYNASFAALIIAAAAFVIACLQTILQYISSADNRNKCSSPVIGWAHVNVKYRWSWTEWKFKVYYPLLDLSFQSISAVILLSGLSVREEREKLPKPKQNDQEGWEYYWKAMDLDDNPSFWNIGYSSAPYGLGPSKSLNMCAETLSV